MDEIARLEAQVEIKSPLEKFFGFYRNNMHHLVQMFPKNIKSFQLQEEMRSGPMTAKVKIEDIDDGDMSMTFNVIQGDVLRFYKSFKAKLQVIKVHKGAGSVEWTVEFEKANENSPDPEHYVDFAIKMSKGLDA
ncbi:MLP-like protein 34 [Fagus crenata]